MVPFSPPLAAFDSIPRTRIVFGNGVVVRLGELARELKATRVLLVTDPGILKAGHVERAIESLRKSGIEATIFSAVRENPTTLDVARCVAAAREAQVDMLVGLGGGSSMDTAKGCNFIYTNGGEMRDYWGVGKATKPMLPLIAIPTTAGTGSECQSAALIADDITHQKMACLDPRAAARIAVLDPELTVSQPARVTAFTGADAITHAVETAVTTKRNPVSQMYSREAFTLCVGSFERVLSHPSDLEARGRMLLGAAFAGTAIEHSMLGAAHAGANPLTAHFGIVHGAAVGILLPHVIRFNSVAPAAKRLYAELASALEIACVSEGLDAAVEALIARIETLLNIAGIPRSLVEAGLKRELIPELATEAARQWTVNFNPRPLSPPDFEWLYSSACDPRQ